MCIAIPSLVVQMLDGQRALVDMRGERREVSLELVDDVQPGDHVMVHLQRALYKVSAAEAELTLSLIDDILRDADLRTA